MLNLHLYPWLIVHNKFLNHQQVSCQDQTGLHKYETTHSHTHTYCLTLYACRLPSSLNHPPLQLSSIGQVRKCWLIYLLIKSCPEDILTKAMNQDSSDLSPHPSVCENQHFATYLQLFRHTRTIFSHYILLEDRTARKSKGAVNLRISMISVKG